MAEGRRRSAENRLLRHQSSGGLQGHLRHLGNNVTIDNLELTGAHVDDSEGEQRGGDRAITGTASSSPAATSTTTRTASSPRRRSTGAPSPSRTPSSLQWARRRVRPGAAASTTRTSTPAPRSATTDHLPVQLEPRPGQRHGRQGAPPEVAPRETDVLYNRITGESGHDSYEVDLPNGGLGVVMGNVIEKGPGRRQRHPPVLREEGIDTPSTDSLYVVERHVRERLHRAARSSSRRRADADARTTTSSRGPERRRAGRAPGRQHEREQPTLRRARDLRLSPAWRRRRPSERPSSWLPSSRLP